MHLGLVTYNLAKDWDLATIIQNCQESGFEGVELRTTHAHGVEVELSARPQQILLFRHHALEVVRVPH